MSSVRLLLVSVVNVVSTTTNRTNVTLSFANSSRTTVTEALGLGITSVVNASTSTGNTTTMYVEDMNNAISM